MVSEKAPFSSPDKEEDPDTWTSEASSAITDADIESYIDPKGMQSLSKRQGVQETANVRNCLRLMVHVVVHLMAAWGLVAFYYQIQASESGHGSLFPSSFFYPSPALSCHAPSLSIDHRVQPDTYHPETLPEGLNICDCGSSIAEAKTKDCVYDSLATAWLPPFCRDDELTKEFDAASDWEYYADKKGTKRLTRDEVAALGDTQGVFWSTRQWHIAHCTFYWQKYRRIRITGAVMEERYDRLEHVRHCSGLILNPLPDHTELIPVPVTLNSSEIAGTMALRNVMLNSEEHGRLLAVDGII